MKYYSKRVRAWEKQQREQREQLMKDKEKNNKNELIFQVERPEFLIHTVSAMRISKNGDNTFNVFYSVNWYDDSNQCTDFDYQRVPKEYVYDLVCGPSWSTNKQEVRAHDIDKERLKSFLK
tara:strand:+ start:1153 stop:1515 length:363 start_codon:yes stop_codon:yes gene_type:complete